MKLRAAPLLMAAALLLSPALATAAEVKVDFKNPDRYVDAGRRGVQRDRTLKALTEYLQKLGEQLPENRQLAIDVLAMDLAGQYEPWQGPPANDDIRYMRSNTWPSMRLQFRLTENGKTVLEGDDSIADMNYQTRSSGSNAGLYYDKRLLEEWFTRRFLEPAAP